MGKSKEPEKKIDVEKTINSILNHRMGIGVSVNEKKLRLEAEKNPKILIEAAEIVRVEVFYL
jgi:hypothetical protein